MSFQSNLLTMSFYKLFLIAFILIIETGILSASNPSIDSLMNELEISKSDSDRAEILIQLSKATYYDEPKRGLAFAEEALSLSEKLDDLKLKAESKYCISYAQYGLGDYELSKASAESSANIGKQIGEDILVIDSYLMIGRACYVTGEVDSAEIYFQDSWDLGEKMGYKKGMGQAAIGLGDIAEGKGDNDKAMDLYQQAIQIFIETGNKEGQMLATNKIAIIYEYKGELEVALAKYLEFLRLAEELENWRAVGAAYTNIASLYHIQKNYDKSLEYAQKAMEYYQKIDNQRGIAFIYHDVGNTLKAQRKLDEALESFQKALKIRIAQNDKRGQSFTYFAMAWNYKHQGDMVTARANMRKSLALREEIGYKSGIHACQRALAKWNMEEKNYATAYPYLQKSYEWNIEKGSAEGIWESLELLVDYYEATGDIKNAFAYQKLAIAAKDSIFNSDQNKQFAEMQTLYETEKKDKEILQQEKDILELEKQQQRISRQRNLTIGGTFLFGLLGFVGYRFNKVRKDRNDKRAFAEALIYTQEEERKRIARDLHDGIGQSLLLIKKQMESTQQSTIENRELITETLEEVRSISRDLHPIQLEKFGLTAVINETVDKIERNADIFTTSEIDNIDGLFSPKAEINIFRTIQEAVNNILKHADATAVKLTAVSSGEEVHIKIQDNGIGFNLDLQKAISNSLGLRTMNERIKSIGGKLTIGKGKPRGTVVEMKIPIENKEKK